MKRSIKIISGILTSVLLLEGAWFVWNYYRDNRLPGFERETELYVYPGYSAQRVMDSLVANAGVKWPKRLAKVFEKHKVNDYIKPGHYVIKPEYTLVHASRIFNNGWETPVKFTLAGTLRLRGEIARKISRQLLVDSATVRNAMEDSVLLAKFGMTPQTVFALFIPDTYEMYWTASVEDIFARQKKAYDSFWSEENLQKAEALKLSRMEIAILASIVSGETNYVPEMPKIAGVYLNRLRKGMKLQADPTIAFCYDYSINRILKSHLKVDSPYNTYKNKGLPPGPIYVPTRNTLNAVLNPDYGNGNLFFCADPALNGTHAFASTHRIHQKNAKAFHKALTAREKEKAAAAKGV